MVPLVHGLLVISLDLRLYGRFWCRAAVNLHARLCRLTLGLWCSRTLACRVCPCTLRVPYLYNIISFVPAFRLHRFVANVVRSAFGLLKSRSVDPSFDAQWPPRVGDYVKAPGAASPEHICYGGGVL